MEILDYDTIENNDDYSLYADYDDMEHGEMHQYMHGQSYEPMYDDEIYEENGLAETVRKVRVVRQGQRVIKKKTNKSGYKVVGGKEVRMSSKERRNRAISQRKAARKRKPHQKAIDRKRKRSLRKRPG